MKALLVVWHPFRPDPKAKADDRSDCNSRQRSRYEILFSLDPIRADAISSLQLDVCKRNFIHLNDIKIEERADVIKLYQFSRT